MNIILYLCTVVSLAVIDSVWLFSMGGFYKKQLAHLFAPDFFYTPAVIFYLMYAVGVIFFVISPALKNGTGLMTVFLTGAFLGLLAYGAYDLTNHATLRDWPLVVTIVDMAWGAMVTGLGSVAAISLYKLFS